jgi:transcriptional regulator with XRE-family HTH domain
MATSSGEDTSVPHAVPIGARLRSARRAARMSLDEVAGRSGLTKGFISKLERDQANASVAALMRLCAALEISAGSLFDPAKGEVVRRDARPPINFGGSGIREYLLTPSGEKRLQAILTEVDPGGGSGEEAYALPAEVEFVFVIAGTLEISLPGETVLLHKGDAFTFPPNTEHSFRAGPGRTRTQVLWVFSPALPDAGEYDVPLRTSTRTRKR